MYYSSWPITQTYSSSTNYYYVCLILLPQFKEFESQKVKDQREWVDENSTASLFYSVVWIHIEWIMRWVHYVVDLPLLKYIVLFEILWGLGLGNDNSNERCFLSWGNIWFSYESLWKGKKVNNCIKRNNSFSTP